MEVSSLRKALGALAPDAHRRTGRIRKSVQLADQDRVSRWRVPALIRTSGTVEGLSQGWAAAYATSQ
jgi:hypothetical protein